MAAMPLSARGSVGEALRKYGSHVPNYDIYGQQHYRLPYKDKARLLETEPLEELTREPKHRTRSDLLKSRRDSRYPDISYDFDGDGVVGPTDYFLGKTFGREQDHRLNTAERQQAVEALEAGFLDRYRFGHDAAGVNRIHGVQQKRGKIITIDSAHDMTGAYPPHWNAHKDPKHKTRTELMMHRRSEMANAANELKDEWDRHNPCFVPEPNVAQEFRVEAPQIASISERQEAFRREAREDAGLCGQTSFINEARERMEPGTGWRDHPPAATRTEMMRQRNFRQLDESLETRLVGESSCLAGHARHTVLEAQDFDYRRGKPTNMTLSKLQLRRRQEKAEYDMARFAVPEKPLAGFSERDAHWFTTHADFVAEPTYARPLPVEVTGKVTENRMEARKKVQILSPEPMTEGPAGRPSPLTDELVKRWEKEFVPDKFRHQARYQAFEGVSQAPTLATDMAPVHNFSSFEVIRKEGRELEKERQRAEHDMAVERAKSWKQSQSFHNGLSSDSTVEPNSQSVPAACRGSEYTQYTSLAKSVSPVSAAVSRQSSFSRLRPSQSKGSLAANSIAGTSRQQPSRRASPRPPATFTVPSQADVRAPEDPPMTERLGRLRGGRAGASLGPALLSSWTPGLDLSDGGSVVSRTPRTSTGGIGVLGGGAGSVLGGAPSLPAVTETAAKDAMAVRTSGFQWLESVLPPSARGGDSQAASMNHSPSRG